MYTYTFLMANQRDVAREAGVSSASVSRYINKPDSIKQKSAGRIKAAIKKLGYRPDYTAQSLKRGKFHRVGIISAAKGPFYCEVINWIEDTLFDTGYFINIAITRESERSKQKPFHLVQNRQVDGILIFPLLNRGDEEIVAYMKKMGDKFVVLDRLYPDDSIFQVAIDNYGAGKTAARTFIEAGHRKFLFIWGVKDTASSHERFRGFYDELKNAGIKLEENRQLPGEFKVDSAYKRARERFPELPEFTAVFASNDLSALGFMKAAHENGLKVPDDFSIIGFDDAEIAPYIVPPLTTFRQPIQTMGALAAKMLISQIEGDEIRDRKILLKAEFILRESLKPVF